MRRVRRAWVLARRLAWALGAVALVGGMTTLLLQRPSAASSPRLVGQASSLTNGEVVSVSGSGFAPSSMGSLMECSLAPGQPTVVVVPSEPPVPVGCTDPLASLVTTTSSGTFQASFKVVEGPPGPPAAVVDSAGRQASLDAAAYPCPPTSDQAAAGAHCVLLFGDTAGDQAQLDLDFANSPVPPSGTPGHGSSSAASDPPGPPAGGGVGLTAAPTPGSPCLPQAGVGSGFRSSVRVDPAYCLPEGQSTTVTVSGAGFAPNARVYMSECSSDLDQPVMSLAGMVVPVSCTNPMADQVPTDPDGGFQASFVVVPGTTGPPAPGADSAGGQATLDATRYPCPPTAAQVISGVVCELKVDDGMGDSVVVPLTWGTPETALPLSAGVGLSVVNGGIGGSPLTLGLTSSAGVPAAAAGQAAGGSTQLTPAGGGALPFTGAPEDLLWLASVGGGLLYLGLPLALGCRAHRRPAQTTCQHLSQSGLG